MKVVKSERSISFKKATNKTSIKHNNRKLDKEEKENKWHDHIDFDRTHLNKILVQEDIKDTYKKIFGDAVKEYNAKQKRNDRKIENYYSKVLKDKKLQPQREFIVQIGERDDYESKEDWEVANKILTNYVEKFEERNFNFKIYNAVIHNDESTPHLHLNVIPVATGYKRGLQKQPSFDKALKQQGIEYDKNDSRSLFRNFRNNEIDFLEKEMQNYQIGRKIVGTNSIKNHHEYKELKKELEKIQTELDEKIEDSIEIENELKFLEEEKEKIIKTVKETHIEEFKGYKSKEHSTNDFILIKRVDFDRLHQQNESIPLILAENKQLKEDNKKLEEEKTEKDTQIDDYNEMLEMARKRLDLFLEGGNDLWDRCITYASKFHKKGKQIANKDMINNKDGEKDFEDWKKQKEMVAKRNMYFR